MKYTLSKKLIITTLIVLTVLLSFFILRRYVASQENSQSLYVDDEVQLNILNNNPHLSYKLNENELNRFVNMSEITSGSLLTRFGQRIRVINIVIDDQIYQETQTVDPQNGFVYISSQVNQTPSVLLINIGLGEIVIPDSIIDREVYLNKLINMSIFNGLHFNESKETIDRKLSTLKRADMDITASMDNYNLIIFNDVEIK